MMSYTSQAARQQMVRQQVRCWDVLDPRVLQVLKDLPREEFVPPAYQQVAYADADIPLAHGELMMTPSVEGRLLQALDIGPQDNILEVGTGSGFLTACLARLGGQVISIDLREDFIDKARQRLQQIQIDNCELQHSDVFTRPDSARYDAIAVTGSMPVYSGEFDSWLKPGGRMFVIEGRGSLMDALLLQTDAGGMRREALFETYLPALRNAPDPQTFRF
jgi:protein-L-isoaspartate(D-aspartate) O-methyltransferase